MTMKQFEIQNPEQTFFNTLCRPPQASDDFALDALAGDFISTTAAPVVKSGFAPPKTARQVTTPNPLWTTSTL